MIKADGKYTLLRAIANSRRLSLTELAGACGCNVASLQKRLQGKQKFKVDEAVRLKKYLKTNESIETLFELDGDE